MKTRTISNAVDFQDWSFATNENTQEVANQLQHSALDRYCQPYANFLNTPEKSAAIAINHYGRGQAIYLATAAQPSIIGPLVRDLYTRLHIERGPLTPAGVYARVVEGRTLYVNTTTATKSVRLNGTRVGVLSGRHYSGSLLLEPYGVELLR